MVNEDIIEQASDWLDRLDELSTEERRELSQWLSISEDHVSAFKSVAAMLGMTELALVMLDTSNSGAVQDTGQIIQGNFGQSKSPVNDALDLVESSANEPFESKTQHSFKWSSPWSLAASVALVLTVSLWQTSSKLYGESQIAETPVESASHNQLQQIDVMTAKATKESKLLGDGSYIHLNADSRVAVKHTESYRNVELQSGQVFFDIASDHNRPFVVSTEQAKITVIGTEFDIETIANKTFVRVYEGVVEVSANTQVTLTAGQSVVVEAGVLSPVAENLQGLRLPQWRTGWVEIEQQPLAEVIAKFQRYHDKQIILSENLKSELQVSGRFNLQQASTNLALVAKSLNLRLVENAQEVTLSALN